jgi:hypothetical protein
VGGRNRFSQQLVDLMVGVPGRAIGSCDFGAGLHSRRVLKACRHHLFGPLLFPVARVMGVNEVHYAIVA